MTDSLEPNYLFKFIIIGDSGVGKTNLFTQFTQNQFRNDSKPTIGVELAIKTFIVNKNVIKTQIWDTAGQQRFRAITAAYYRSALGVIMVFDLTNSKSFQNLHRWFKQLETYGQNNPVVLLVGNKSDLTNLREVRLDSIEAFANQKNCLYLQTSAATGSNVDEAFNLLVSTVFKKQMAHEQQKKLPQTTPPKDKLQKTNSNIQTSKSKTRLQVKPKDKHKKTCC